jgi:hypothetical protein
LVAIAALGFPGAAFAVERIRSPFLLEYSAPDYFVDQGEIVTFENTDPFLTHGLASDYSFGGRSAFDAPILSKGQTRLVRGAPFLSSAGSPYTFRDPAHPGMTSTLVVSTAGAPLPLDAVAPVAQVKVRSRGVGGIARTGRLRLAVRVSEAADVVAKARVGRALLRGERTFVAPSRRVMALELASRGRLPASGARARVTVKLSDVAGNPGTVTVSRRLSGEAPRGKR